MGLGGRKPVPAGRGRGRAGAVAGIRRGRDRAAAAPTAPALIPRSRAAMGD
jgi:hypothetical protein